jgi:hypothetical protein
VLAVVERAVALQGAFRLDPQLVEIGADPSLSLPAELGIGAAGAAFELTEHAVGKNLLIVNRLYGAARRHVGHCGRLVGGHGRLRRRGGRQTGDRGGKREDAGGAHATCTSRNMPVSM